MRKFIAATAAILVLLTSGCSFLEGGFHLREAGEIVCESQNGYFVFPVEPNSVVVFRLNGFTVELYDNDGDIEFEQSIFFLYGADCSYAID